MLWYGRSPTQYQYGIADPVLATLVLSCMYEQSSTAQGIAQQYHTGIGYAKTCIASFACFGLGFAHTKTRELRA